MSKALGHDLFADLSAEFIAAHADVADPFVDKQRDMQLQLDAKDEEIQQLQKEISRLTEERDYLKKIIDVLAAKVQG